MGRVLFVTQPETPSSASRGRDAAATRAALLEAAMVRFTVLGYERTTTRDIAAHAGVNVSLINRYFGSKDGLFAAAMKESAHSIEQFRASPSADVIDSMVGRLDSAAWPEYGSEHPLLLLLRDVGEDDRVVALRRQSLNAVVDRLADHLGDDSTPDPGLRAELVLALVAGVLTLRRTLPDSALARADADQLRSLLKGAITAISDMPGVD